MQRKINCQTSLTSTMEQKKAKKKCGGALLLYFILCSPLSSFAYKRAFDTTLFSHSHGIQHVEDHQEHSVWKPQKLSHF